MLYRLDQNLGRPDPDPALRTRENHDSDFIVKPITTLLCAAKIATNPMDAHRSAKSPINANHAKYILWGLQEI
jgi:hypothetical protein